MTNRSRTRQATTNQTAKKTNWPNILSIISIIVSVFFGILAAVSVSNSANISAKYNQQSEKIINLEKQIQTINTNYNSDITALSSEIEQLKNQTNNVLNNRDVTISN